MSSDKLYSIIHGNFSMQNMSFSATALATFFTREEAEEHLKVLDATTPELFLGDSVRIVEIDIPCKELPDLSKAEEKRN